MDGIAAKQPKILLVEDDPIVGFKEARMLENNGYAVVRSSTGESAVRIFADDPDIELIVMDLDLGDGIDGAEAARRILRQRDVPISFLTAHHEKKYVDRIRSVPNYGYILKNSGEYVLLNAIERGFAQFKEKLERESHYAEVCSICEGIPVMTLCLDEERVVRKMNRAAEEYLGTAFRAEKERAEDPVGNVLRCVHRDEDPRGCGYGRGCKRCKLRGLFLETIRNGNKSHRATVPMRLQMNGTAAKAAFRASAVLLSPGKGKTVILTMEDITELHEYEKLLHTITENIPEILTITDQHLNFTYISRSNEKLTGYTAEEMESLSIKDLLTPDSYARVTELMRTWSPEGETLLTLELEHVKKDGGTFWAEEIVTPLRNGAGEVCGFLTASRDITALKKKEAELNELLRENRNLLTEINHRVSNNLATVEALAHVELSTGEKSKEDSIRDIINRVKAIHLIHNKMYRTDNFTGISLPEYIRDLAEAISASLYENEAQFRLNFELDEMNFPPKYNTPLGIMTAELLTNTFKYAVFADTCEIDLRIRREGPTVHFTYRDSGTGLKGKADSFDDLTGGTGLLLIRELVAGLDGEITLNTDNGTEFRVNFPFPA